MQSPYFLVSEDQESMCACFDGAKDTRETAGPSDKQELPREHLRQGLIFTVPTFLKSSIS